MKAEILKLRYPLAVFPLILVLGIANCLWPMAEAEAQTVPGTPVSFPLVPMFGSGFWHGSLTLTAAQSRWTDGTNIYGGTFLRTNLMGNITNLVIVCQPNGYTVSQDGIRQTYSFYLPPGPGTNVVNVLSLSTNIPTLTNYFTVAGTATNVNNATGTNVSLHGLFNGVDPSQGITAFTPVQYIAASFNISDVPVSISTGWLDLTGIGYGAHANSFWGATFQDNTGTFPAANAIPTLGGNNIWSGNDYFQNNLYQGGNPVVTSDSISGVASCYGGFAAPSTGQFWGNAQGETNFTGLVVTNSPAGWLTAGAFRTVPATGFITVSVLATNTQIVWLTNVTAHICIPIGQVTGTTTNYDSAALFVKPGDSIGVTNMAGGGGASLAGSWFQALH